MRSSHFSLLILLNTAIIGLVAQAPGAAQPSAGAAGARRRPVPVRSPQILADHRVTFQLHAPKASEVAVAGQWPKGRAALTKDGNDVWRVTAGPIPAGIWEYSFQVDGVQMLDPGNPAIKPMREPRTSILHIPGEPPLPHDFQNVPHGTVRQHTYLSKSLGRLRELVVYTPPGYDQQADARFPTLYLQHGMGDNQATWVAHGKAHWILDNLIAQGKARPMVVVMLKEKDIRHEWHLTDGNHSWPVWRLYLAELASKLFQ